MTDTASTALPTSARLLPALLLTILGNILVVVILAVAAVLFVVAGLVVFGPDLLAML
ncbi:hypothetical protein [Microbacterium sp. RU33B]|uniref:hypothetical protein n=1 Tax=Microbacterium sp. RU33B TaxID=1907390 RepID=UPI0015C3EE9A|nr:hypothetical protein [Microbacterium sp. RU33B]